MRFGVRLVRDDKITVNQLEEALSLQSSGDDRKIGEILADKGFIDKETLDNYMTDSGEA